MNTRHILQHIAAASAELRHCAQGSRHSTEVSGTGPDRFIVTSLSADRSIHLLTPDGLGHRLTAAQARTLAHTLVEHAERLTHHSV